MSLLYKITNLKTKEVITTDDLYGTMEELLDDEYVEDFINEISEQSPISYLDGYKAGTILRFLSDTGENDFQNAWESARQDFLAISYDAVNDGIDWERCAYYEYYRITPVIEGS